MKKSKITDFDPESLLDPAPSSSSDEHSDDDFSDVEDPSVGREHYAAVGKSKLRQNADLPEGPSYKGKTVSRNELEDSDSDDPFAKGFDDEDSEDDDEDGIVKGVNGVELDGESGSDEEGFDEDMDDDEDMDSEDEAEQDEDATESSEEESGDEAKPRASAMGKSDVSDVRSIMKDTKSFTSNLAAGAQSDVAKGQAVKTQRKTFDTLLNTRIRLQKALISTNSMAAGSHKDAAAPASSMEAAEAAALTLLNNLTDLRMSLEEARTGHKRKRTVFDSETPSAEIWSSISSSEKSALPNRKAVLERWSTKTRATTVTNNKNRLNASATQTLTEVLDSQLQSSHLVTRTQTPRSCAPIQSNASNKGSQPDPAIYDDADFYGLMLKELLEQRSAENANGGAAEFVVQAPWQVAREAKTKKIVDTKASKGRRLRYTVQEKLQNFMAPEERGVWEERQRDELFGSLFGRRVGLAEVDDGEDEVEDGVDAEEAGLMLFRN
ncbi:protein BFR2 [Parastagonospora nodorum]|nr:protein BFR2 [Parastagonospora nodorum]KAH4434760.1 protein BFR2 [Parastagonospora nodorum]KAH4446530.1 protein BFR2 [Parastagonospora nodorum]KAH4501747.1 protein BFR2 [Parastagonospora nodorum]KAH4538332.1 protein BFR2 [Parastagonospora nodorum]